MKGDSRRLSQWKRPSQLGHGEFRCQRLLGSHTHLRCRQSLQTPAGPKCTSTAGAAEFGSNRCRYPFQSLQHPNYPQCQVRAELNHPEIVHVRPLCPPSFMASPTGRKYPHPPRTSRAPAEHQPSTSRAPAGHHRLALSLLRHAA